MAKSKGKNKSETPEERKERWTKERARVKEELQRRYLETQRAQQHDSSERDSSERRAHPLMRAMLDATPEARRATCNRLAEIFIAGLKATGDSLSNITADLAEDTEQARIDRTALDLLKDIDV